jgi:hypothetical protein
MGKSLHVVLHFKEGIAAPAAVDNSIEGVFLVTPGINTLKPCFV